MTERRQFPRWKDQRLVTLQTRDAEHAGVSENISLGGMRLAAVGGAPEPGAAVKIVVAFPLDILHLRGRVVEVNKARWGSFVRVHFETPYSTVGRHVSRVFGQT